MSGDNKVTLADLAVGLKTYQTALRMVGIHSELTPGEHEGISKLTFECSPLAMVAVWTFGLSHKMTSHPILKNAPRPVRTEILSLLAQNCSPSIRQSMLDNKAVEGVISEVTQNQGGNP